MRAGKHCNVRERTHRAFLFEPLRLEHVHAACDAANLLGDKHRLGEIVRRLHQPHLRAVRAVRVQHASLSPIVCDHRQGGFEHCGSGAVVFHKADGAQAGYVLSQPCKAAAARPAEAVDRLVRVADHEQAAPVAPRTNKSILRVTHILKFVHQQVAELFAARGVQPQRFSQQIVKVERTERFQPGAVVLVQRVVQPCLRRGRAVFDARDRLQ